VFSTVDSGLTNLIHDRCSCTLFTLSSVSSRPSACLFTLGRSPVEANSVVVTLVGVSLSGCVHSSVNNLNKPGANGRVSYDSLTHSGLYCRDRERK